MSFLKKLMCLTLVVACFAICANSAQAEYPTKPITVVVPFGAGGDGDVSARVWAEFVKKELGQPVLVVNKTGSGSLAGTLFAAKSKPDGYTLFLGQAGPCIVLPLLTKTGGLSFDSFDYVTRFIRANTAVVVSKDAPWNNLKEFQADALKNPGKYVFSTPAATAWVTLAFSSWAHQNGVKLRNVNYSSAAEAATAILGKHSDIAFLFPNNYETLVDSDKFKILAIGSKSEKYPSALTFEEQGYDGSFFGWSGIVVPKGVPQEIIDKLIAVSDKVHKDPNFIKAIKNLGFTPDNVSGAAWKAEAKAQYEELKTLLSEIGIIKK